MFRNTLMVALVTVVSLCTAGLADAASTAINVDLNSGATLTYDGSNGNAAGDPGTFWNGLNLTGTQPFTTAPNSLKYGDGTTTATGVTVTIGSYASTSGFTTTFANGLFNDFAFDTTNSNSSTGTFAISGLQQIPYDLYLYSMTGYNGSPNNTLFSVNGVTTLVTGFPEAPDHLDSTFIPAVTGVSTGTNNGNYVLYSHMVPTLGTIAGTFQGTNERLNGFQVVEAPEPASLGLLLAGGVTLLKRRRV